MKYVIQDFGTYRLPTFHPVELEQESKDFSLNGVHVDGDPISCDSENKRAWVAGMKQKAFEITKLLEEAKLECQFIAPFCPKGDLVNNSGHFRVIKAVTMATKVVDGVKLPDWYTPVEWPKGNPDGDENQKVILAGVYPPIPPP